MNVKEWLVAKLLANSALMALIGGTSHFVFFYPDSFSTLPMLTYSESLNADTEYFDDVPKASRVVYTFDIYSKTSTSAIYDALKAAMNALLFNQDFATDLYETVTKIHHKNIRFSRTIRTDDLI